MGVAGATDLAFACIARYVSRNPSFQSRSQASTSGWSTRIRQKVTNAPSAGGRPSFMPPIHFSRAMNP
jgi:hypothetical protein